VQEASLAQDEEEPHGLLEALQNVPRRQRVQQEVLEQPLGPDIGKGGRLHALDRGPIPGLHRAHLELR
jgi:hypothetical protein